MICDIGATFGHNVRPGDHSRMCSEPIGTYAMSFWPFPTHTTHFNLFSMFLCYFRCLLTYIGLITTSLDYLCVSHTIVYLCDAFPTLSDFLLTLFIFTVIDIPMFWLFIVSVDRTIAIDSDFDPYKLLVISDPSDTISTSPSLFLLIFYLPLPFYTE